MKFERGRKPATPPWLAAPGEPAGSTSPGRDDDPDAATGPTDTPTSTDHTEVFQAVSDDAEVAQSPVGPEHAVPPPPPWVQGSPPPPPQWDQGPPPPPLWEQGPPPPPQWDQGPPPQPQWDQGPPPQPQWNHPGPPGPPPWENPEPHHQGPPQWDRGQKGPGPWQQPGPPPQWQSGAPQFAPEQPYPQGPDPAGQHGPPPRWAGPDRPQFDGPPPPHFQQQPYPPQAPFHGPPPGYGGQQNPAQLDTQALLRKARRAPQSGWRRTVHRISGGSLNPGDSRDTVYFDQLVHRLNAPIRGDFRIAVLSLKGGVGKTTTTIGLGSTFSHLRGDRVIAVDANPDLGTLAQRVPQQSMSTVRDVLNDDSIFRYSDIRAHTSQAPSRLEVLASERDPAIAETFGEQDYRSVMRVLQRFYNIILTDCGTGLSHSAMNGVLDLANALILVSTPAIDGARSASATLDWLQAHGYGYLVSRAIVVLSGPRRGSTTINLDQLAQHFLARTRAVQIVPYDQHLAEGADIDLELLDRGTRRAFVELAATVAEDFAITTRQD